MTTPTVDQFIAACRAEVGYKEAPVNRTKFAAIARQANGAAWCHTFLVAMAIQTGLQLVDGVLGDGVPDSVAGTAYTPAGMAGWKAAGRLFAGPQVGDWGYCDFPGDGVDRVSHVVLVTAIHPDGTVSTIEGNTSIGSTGDQRDGLWVAEKRRNRSIIKGYGRPKYGVPAVQAPPAVIVRQGSPEAALLAAYPDLFKRPVRIFKPGDVAAAANPSDIALGLDIWGAVTTIKGADRYETLKAAVKHAG